MPHRLNVMSGANALEQPLGGFIVRAAHDGPGAPEVKVTAGLLAPHGLSERQRASGIPSTVDMSIPVSDAIDLAMKILLVVGTHMKPAQIAELQRMASERKPK
jgi:hypothetical protein